MNTYDVGPESFYFLEILDKYHPPKPKGAKEKK